MGMRVEAIAWTRFTPPASVEWQPDPSAETDGGAALAEFAGRSCYEAWDRPHPRTATNAGYLRHVLQVGHHTLFEHASASLYITGISRAVSHELVRHRHFSISELSPRHVPDDPADVVEPELIAADPQLHERFVEANTAAADAYAALLEGLDARYPGEGATLRRKQLRAAARDVLPRAQATHVVMTGNLRAWRHFLAVRASEHAEPQLRAVAVACLVCLRETVPGAFDDFEITELPDGSQVASSPLANDA